MRLPRCIRSVPRFAWRCTGFWCKHRVKKQKVLEDEDLEASIDGNGRVVFATTPCDAPSPLARGNLQDADESCIPIPVEVESWQMPDLVVQCAKRQHARIHKGTSLILPDAGGDLIASIVHHLPVLQKIKPQWHLGYSMAVDGVSMRTLYRQIMDVGPCLLIIEDSHCCIFGCFSSEGLKPQNRCYGTHESFLFRFSRDVGAWRTEVFSWSHRQLEHEAQCSEARAGRIDEALKGYDGPKANYFQALQNCHGWAAGGSACSSPANIYCDYSGIVIGMDGPAIFIDQDLLRGVSCPSKFFGSPCMAAVEPDFVIRNLEVWHWVG